MNIVCKNIITHVVSLAISIALLSMVTACNAASDVIPSNPKGNGSGNVMSPSSPGVKSDNFEGTWIGTIGGTTKVTLVIKPGGDNATLTYGGNRECTAKGENQSVDTDKPLFKLYSQNGGPFCDSLQYLTVKNTTTNVLSYTVTFDDKKTNEEGTLNKK